MMIGNEYAFDRNHLLFEYVLSVFDSCWFPYISLYFSLYPCLLE